MKIKYHACVRYEYTYSKKLLSLLIAERIEYSDLAGNAFIFDFFSDNPKCDEILYLLKDNPLTIPMAVYSKGEMGKAEWFLMEATRTFIETNNFEYTFDMLCEYQTSYDTRYHHIVQKNPYVVKLIPKWKPKFNFCSEGSGDFSTIFCSDEAREKLIESKIQGIEFLPLLKEDLVTPQRKVHQLSFSQKLPITAFDFIRPYKEQICQNCGKINYVFEKPNLDNVRIKINELPIGIDAFSSDFLVGSGWGQKLIVVSKKVYEVIKKDMVERNINFIPVG